jgi:3-oxoacyl-[acyl-carrier protein] reductase
MSRVALVTGASRGIGAAIAEELAAADYHVLINFSRDGAGAESVLRRIQDAGGDAELFRCSVTDEAAVRQAIRTANISRLDLLVNNAGILHDSLIIQAEPEMWRSVIVTNFIGSLTMYRATECILRESDDARVTSIASISAFAGGKGQSSYAASKAMLLEWSNQMAMQREETGITFTTLSPGPVLTEMVRSAAFYSDPKAKNIIPMRRFGEPLDIAKIVRFIAEAPAALINGCNWIADGGFTLSPKSMIS